MLLLLLLEDLLAVQPWHHDDSCPILCCAALLSEDLCSLRGGQDRYAVSVLWTIDAETLQPQRVWYGRTLIR